MAEPLHRADAELHPANNAAREHTQDRPSSGRALLEALQSEGIIGLWRDRRDITDSATYARALRAAAETRA